MSKAKDFEIGDGVVFAKYDSCDIISGWRSGRITDIAGRLVEVAYPVFFGWFTRHRWLEPTGLGNRGWIIYRKDRAEELIARHQPTP